MIHAGIKVHTKKPLDLPTTIKMSYHAFSLRFFFKLKTSFLAGKKLNIHMLKAAAYIGQNILITTLNIKQYT